MYRLFIFHLFYPYYKKRNARETSTINATVNRLIMYQTKTVNKIKYQFIFIL